MFGIGPPLSSIVPAWNWWGNTIRAWDIQLAAQGGPKGIARRQVERFGELVAFARANSPFYRRLYQELPENIVDIKSLPITSKIELMEIFDEWVTDQNVTRDAVAAFVADRSKIGSLFDDQYAVWKSSGTSGQPGIFLHDRRAMAIYDLLFAQRAWAVFPFRLGPNSAWGQEWRMACITAIEDHFAGISCWLRMALEQPLLRPLMHEFSVLIPLDQLVRALNECQPRQIFAYPSVLAQLAQEQNAGRLDLSPAALFAGGECLDDFEHTLIESAFGCSLRCVYACAECDYIAFECGYHNFHVNADWIILEPIDAKLNPVEPGVTSHTVLVTNLANRIQPIIRYQLGDSITMLPEPCPCGNLLPAIKVEGRRDEVLHFQTRDGVDVTILPMAITTVLDLIPGLRRFQIVRDGLASVWIGCEFSDASSAADVSREVHAAISHFLTERSLSNITVRVEGASLSADPVSGKFHQVISALNG